jgi:hypothetical protein
MQLPNPPWYRRWSVILAGVIGLAVITAMLGLRGLQQVASPSTTGSGPTPTTVVDPTTTTTPPTSLQPPETTTTLEAGELWRMVGHDGAKSPGIEVPGAWRIEWSFDCTNFKKFGAGSFKITGDGAFKRVEIQWDAIKHSGSNRFRGGGFGHLAVDSVCDHWTVSVRRG